MIEETSHRRLHLFTEIKCPVCKKLRNPFEVKVFESRYVGQDDTLVGYVLVSLCCKAILCQTGHFDNLGDAAINTTKGFLRDGVFIPGIPYVLVTEYIPPPKQKGRYVMSVKQHTR